jgi:VWFA-related protein
MTLQRKILSTGILVYAIGFFLVAVGEGGFYAGATLTQASTSAANSGQAASPLRSTTRLVQVSAIVEDKQGHAVTGLTKNDFTVLDNGKREGIEVFLARERKARNRSAAALPPDTYSNRITQHSSPMSATVILLDGLNTRIADQQYARAQVVKFLEQIQPQDRIALYTLGTDLRLLHDFTNDASSLLAVLQTYAGRLSPSSGESAARRDQDRAGGERGAQDSQNFVLDAPPADMFAPFLNPLGESEADFDTRDRSWRTVDALKQIGNHLALLPGRKNLVWVAGSFLPVAYLQDVEMNTPDGGLLFTADLDALSRAMNNASLAVYPVDARGLVTTHAEPAGFAAMDMIAKRTGGRAFYETNDIFGAIRDAVDDSFTSYEIGYYPEITNWDGSFHKVRISVNRPGASVRTREGYYAAHDRKITPAARQSFFAAALTNLVDADGLEVTVHVNPSTTEAKANEPSTLAMSVTVEPEDLTIELNDGRETGTLGTVFVQIDDKGTVLGATDDAFEFKLAPEQYQQAMKYGLSYKGNVNVKAGATELRVVVRDGASGKVGAATVPLARYFPPPAKPTT